MSSALSDRPAVNWEGSVNVNLMWLAVVVIPVHHWHLVSDLMAANVRNSHSPVSKNTSEIMQQDEADDNNSTLVNEAYYCDFFSLLFAACECDPRGSVSELCDQVRGQCACRSEVTGRRCDHCRTGFWDFPLCRPCECNGLSEECDEDTGECLNCREHATGPNCDRSLLFLTTFKNNRSWSKVLSNQTELKRTNWKVIISWLVMKRASLTGSVLHFECI